MTSESATPIHGSDASRLSASLRTLFDVGTLSGLADAQLLDRFRRGGTDAEAAFAALVERHGPMALAACRAVLGDPHDAEDACQAAFLVLAQRAGSIRRGEAVASWLDGVARRVAARARRDLARRRDLERRRLEKSEPAAPPAAESWPELYEELDRLAEPFRAAVVLCDLEGRSYEQAAGLLGCPVGTVQSRLSRGRQRLRSRLERRGITPAIVGVAALPSAPSIASSAAIVRAAMDIMKGRSLAAAAPAAVATMAGAGLRGPILKRLAMTLTTLLIAGLLTTTAIALSAIGPGDPPQTARLAATGRPHDGPIHVRVVDLDGKGVAGATVATHGWLRTSRSFAADADGRATIPRDAIGERGTLIARRGPAAIGWGSVGAGAPEAATGSPDDPIFLMLLPIDHRIEGSVVDAQKRPVAGVMIRPLNLNHPIDGLIFEDTAREGWPDPPATDAAGRFSIAMPRGVGGSLRVDHPRWAGWVGFEPDAGTLPPAVVEPAGSVVGRVTDATTGRPIAGAIVALQLVERRSRGLGVEWSTVTTDDRGRFVLGGAEPGVYNVLFEAIPGRPRATARAVECVRVRAGADTPVELAVIEGRPLRVLVFDRATDRPIPGAEIGCYGPARPRSGPAVDLRRADDQGRVTFHVPPGEQYVYLMDNPPNRPASQTVVVPEDGEVEPVRLVKRPPIAQKGGMMGGMMKAVVRPPAKPAGNMTAVMVKALIPRDAPAEAGTEPNREESARADGAPAAKADAAPAGPPKIRTVTGHVRDPRGRPLAGVQLGIRYDLSRGAFGPDVPNPEVESPITDRDGLFLFPGLPRRPLTIMLSRSGSRSQTVELPADRDEANWTFDLIPDEESRRRIGASDEPIPPEIRRRLMFVDLAPRGTDDLTEGPGGSGNNLDRLPRGIHKLGETYFRIGEEIIHVGGRIRADLPQSVKGIAIGARGRVLHFLHATEYGYTPGELIGAYLIRYDDGTTERIPLVCGRQLTDWWDVTAERRVATEAKVAWTGSNVAIDLDPSRKLQLFDLPWTNPHPDKPIAAIDMLSAGKESDPFLVAVTLERAE